MKFGPRTFKSTKFITHQNWGPKSLVKIGPVTAEILMMWTNVARAYMLPGQMSPSFKHGPKILPLKFGQNQDSYN